MAWTLCTSGAAVLKATAKVNATIAASGAALLEWSDKVEGDICSITRYDWVTNYSGLSTRAKNALSDLSSDMIAVKMIHYDTDGFSSSRKAELALDVLTDNVNRNLMALKSETVKEAL